MMDEKDNDDHLVNKDEKDNDGRGDGNKMIATKR